MNNKNNTELPPSSPNLTIKFGLSVLFVVFVLIGGWMALAPLTTSVVASGKVTAGIDKKTVQHLEGGIVDKIYVKNGDIVKKGDILLKFSSVQIKAQLDILLAQDQDAIARLARLKAQKLNQNSIVFPKELSDKLAIQNQNNIFYATKKTIGDEKKITNNRILQFQNQISGQNSLIASKKKRLDSIAEELIEQEALFKDKLVSNEKMRALRKEKDSIDGDIARTYASIAKLEEQISEAKNQQLLKEKQFKQDTLEKYVKVKSKISDLKSKIIANEDKLQKTSIIAPISGTVIGLDIHTKGGVIGGGKPILEIVPLHSKLIVEAEIKTTDIDKVVVGLSADIKFPAFPVNLIDVVKGKVSYVSADSFVNKKNGMSFYKVKIEVSDAGYQALKESGLTLVPGMPASVMINIGQRTVVEYLVKPFKNMLSRSFNEE